MPLRLEDTKNGKASILSNCDGWVITFHGYEVVFAAYKTHFGLPLWRHVFDPPLEIIPGQQISFDCDGNLIS